MTSGPVASAVSMHVPCPHRYLINFLLDATVGMLLIYVGVRAVSVLVEWQQWESLRFGEYGNMLWTGREGTAGGLCSLPHAAHQANRSRNGWGAAIVSSLW